MFNNYHFDGSHFPSKLADKNRDTLPGIYTIIVLYGIGFIKRVRLSVYTARDTFTCIILVYL